MWKNNVEPGSQQMTTWRMRIEFWTPKATDKHSYHVIFFAFPQQRWLHDRALMLPYTYFVCLSGTWI